MCRYLQDDQHYIDLYDLHTIKKCLNLYHDIQKSFKDKRNSAEFKNYTQENFNKEVHKIASYTVNIIKANRYRDKK